MQCVDWVRFCACYWDEYDINRLNGCIEWVIYSNNILSACKLVLHPLHIVRGNECACVRNRDVLRTRPLKWTFYVAVRKDGQHPSQGKWPGVSYSCWQVDNNACTQASNPSPITLEMEIYSALANTNANVSTCTCRHDKLYKSYMNWFHIYSNRFNAWCEYGDDHIYPFYSLLRVQLFFKILKK